MLGLRSTDVGQPINRLKLQTDMENLEQKMLDVMSEVRPKHRVKDLDGQWRDMRLTPYRTADNRIDSVVLSMLSFEDLLGRHRPTLAQPAGQPTQGGFC